MTHETLAEIAALAGAAGAALVVLGPPRRLQLAAGFCVLVAAEAMLIVALLPRDDLERLASAAGIAALVVGALAAAAGAWAFVRWPSTVPVALLLAAPFRIPVELGSQDAFLLLPLYVVLAAASLALLYRAFPRKSSRRSLSGSPRPPPRSSAGHLRPSCGRSTPRKARSRCSSSSSRSRRCSRSSREPRTPCGCRGRSRRVSSGLAVVFAAIGLYQAWTHTLVFAQDLRVANAYTTYFRVTSLFKDPSIYGRQLVLGLGAARRPPLARPHPRARGSRCWQA